MRGGRQNWEHPRTGSNKPEENLGSEEEVVFPDKPGTSEQVDKEPKLLDKSKVMSWNKECRCGHHVESESGGGNSVASGWRAEGETVAG